MAVSAFKSTTRRRGVQVTPTPAPAPADQESSGLSRTLSEHLTAHHHKLKYHKRSGSSTDLSPYSRHSGDSPRFRGTRALRVLDRQLSERDLGKNKPIESDAESTASESKHGSEAISRLGAPQVIHRDNGMRHTTLQRSVSAHDKIFREHPEGQVEEKIIRAVHAQNKPKRSEALPRDQSELYNMIKAEVFDVVADMKDALENSQERALSFDCSACEFDDKSNTSISEEIVKVFRYVCKGYAAKIDKVEEEVKQLRSQLDEKEKICLELTNFINELIPESGAVQLPQEGLPYQDKERRKIFKYVSEQEKGAYLAPARNGSILDDDACVERLSSEQILLELEKEAEQGRWSFLQSGSMPSSIENNDGLVLPWLHWEDAANVQCHSSRKVVKHMQEGGILQDSSQGETSFSERKLESYEERFAKGMPARTRQRKDDHDTVSKPTRYTRSSSIKSSHAADSSLQCIQSAELISERIQFRARVDAGELLLCIGTLHIF